MGQAARVGGLPLAADATQWRVLCPTGSRPTAPYAGLERADRVYSEGRSSLESLRIREVEGSGAYGIDIEHYRRKGLIIP